MGKKLLFFGLGLIVLISGCINQQNNSCDPLEQTLATLSDPNLTSLYCSQENKVWTTYTQCIANGEPSIAGATCFLGV